MKLHSVPITNNITESDSEPSPATSTREEGLHGMEDPTFSESTSSILRRSSESIEKAPEQPPDNPKPTFRKDPLKIFMYSLPPEFNWQMLVRRSRPTVTAYGPGLFESDLFPNRSDPHWGWRGSRGNFSARFPVYAANPSVQQYATEFYLYLSIIQGLPSVVRVSDPSEAEVFFAPFFSSLSYNANYAADPENDKRLQSEFVRWVKGQSYWKRNKGKDHLIVAAHPNALWHKMPKLNSSMLLVADFSRSAGSGSYFEKDIVVPYKAFLSPLLGDDDSSESWNRRTTLAYFLGGLKRRFGGYIREKLREVLAGEEDIKMLEGRPNKDSILVAEEGMAGSKFCLAPAGDTPSSCRLFDAIMRLCVPVVISQALEFPFEDVLDYSTFAVIVPTYKALSPGYLPNLLRNIRQAEWEVMHQRLKEVRQYFIHSHPAQPGGAEDMIWQAVARKFRGESSAEFRDKRLEIQERAQDPASKYIFKV